MSVHLQGSTGTRRLYRPPQIVTARSLTWQHAEALSHSRVDVVTAGLAGVRSVPHAGAYDYGIRGDGDLAGLLIPYWEPVRQRFSNRFVRVKPDMSVAGRKYLQPVGELPRLYFIPGVTVSDLENTQIDIFLTEGEKKALALERARLEMGISAVVVGIGGVWSWRSSPKELQPDGRLGKGKSRPIADLDLIQWTGRTVYLVFDSDAITNLKVSAAETALARELNSRGAHVHIVRLPGGSSWSKSA
jgi:hypothetical protein